MLTESWFLLTKSYELMSEKQAFYNSLEIWVLKDDDKIRNYVCRILMCVYFHFVI